MRLLVLYGSQTGCSEEVAERIGRDALKRKLWATVLSMDSYPMDNLVTETHAVFVCATTGQGDPPDNMKKSWRRMLQTSFPQLPNLHFGVFGLGDSSYTNFNVCAKKLHNRLKGLGAIPMLDRGLGDDQDVGGPDKELTKWIDELWPALASTVSPADLAANPALLAPPSSNLLPARFSVTVDTCITPESAQTPPVLHHEAEFDRVVKLVGNTRLTAADHFQDVRHFTFQFSPESDARYQPGDVLSVVPWNDDEHVSRMLSRMKMNGAHRVCIRRSLQEHGTCEQSAKTDGSPCFHNRWVTLYELFKFYLDIRGCPRRYWFEVLSHYTSNEEQKERLEYFGSPAAATDLHHYCTKEHRSYVETLEDFPTVELPLDRLLDVLPRIRPRQFSISSAPSTSPSTLTLTVGVVEYTTPYKRKRTGLCSSFLAGLAIGTELRVSVASGGIRLPAADVPIIMVGPGTGIAPFRAFIQERCTEDGMGTSTVLFAGCRNQSKDFLYGNELKEYQDQGTLTLIVAFSRDQPHKVYVQTKMRENAKLVADLVTHRNAHVFISGNAKQMPADVTEALHSILCQQRTLTEKQADEYIARMKRTSRLVFDTWS